MSFISLSTDLPRRFGNMHRLDRRRADDGFEHSPRAYANQLATYLRDPSTIRARTVDMFGVAPPIESIRNMIALAQRPDKARSDHWCGRHLDDDDDDGLPWRPRGLVKAEEPPSDILETVVVLEVLNDIAAATRVPATPAGIIVAIAAAYGVDPADIVGPKRHRPIVRARNAVAHILRQRGNSLPSIARFLGRTDHSTMHHSCKQFEARADDRERAIVRRFYRTSPA